MKKRPLPPCFVQLPVGPLLEVLREAKAIRLPMNVVLEDLLQRGLRSIEERRVTDDDLEAEWCAFLVDGAPHMLDAAQWRILDASREIDGVWTRRVTLTELEEGVVDDTPRLNEAVFKRAYVHLRRKATESADRQSHCCSARPDADGKEPAASAAGCEICT